MANKVTQEDIVRFNELYYKNHNYSRTARETGFSPSTVKKYIIKDYTPLENIVCIHFDESKITPLDLTQFEIPSWGSLCVLSDDEINEIRELQKELRI